MALSQLQCTVQKWIHFWFFFSYQCHERIFRWSCPRLIKTYDDSISLLIWMYFLQAYTTYLYPRVLFKGLTKNWALRLYVHCLILLSLRSFKNLKQKKKGILFMKCSLYRVAERISLVLAEFNFKLACVVFSNLAVSVSCNDRLEPTLPIYHVSLFPLYQCQTRVALDCATENVPVHQNFP